MRIVPPEMFARITRRRERARTAPLYGIVGCIGLGLVAPLFWGHWHLPLYLLSSLGLPGAYLAGYVGEVAKGRMAGTPPGRVVLRDEVIELEIGELATRVSPARIVGARFFSCDHFEDLKGMHDVLELHIVTGARLRIPDALDGFAAFLEEMRQRRNVTYT